jgi:histidinol-phosphate aminotransferase
MTYILSEKLQSLEPYKVITEDCQIRLDANESFVDPGEELKTKLLAAWGDIALNRYPDDSYLELRQAFGRYYGVDPELVLAGNGSDELLSLLIGCFLKSDDRLLLTEPDFSMYSVFASTYERQTCYVGRNKEGDPDIPAILETVRKEKVSAVLFSNPSSSFSTVTAREKILSLIDNTDALVVVDEAYMDFSDQSLLQDVVSRDNLIVLRTCSKALGCAGIRLGFAVSSPKLVEVLNALRAPYNLNTLSAEAGRIVLSEPNYITNAIAQILENRRELYEELKPLEASPMIRKIYPTATNYICVETGYTNKIYEELKARSILIRNLKNMLRITVGTKEENQAVVEGLRTIIEYISESKTEGKGQ